MITNKDISIDKDGNIILNGDKYPLASQAEIDAVKDDIDDLGDTVGDITQTGVTGATVAAQLGALKTSIKGLNVKDITITDNLNSINPNSYEQYTIDITRQGYMPLAVCGVSYTGGVGVDIARFYNSSTTASLLLHNVTANTYTPDSLTVSILYIEV